MIAEAAVVKQSINERLENVFQQLLDLYQRHAQERQLILKEKEDLVKLVQLLISQTKEIGQYENGIRKRIQDCIKESAEIAMQPIEKTVADKSSHAIAQIVHKIDQSYAAMDIMINRIHKERSLTRWKVISAAIVSGVITGLLSVWLLIPKPILPLTSEQIGYLQQEQILVQIWPKLTKQEKGRLKAISYEIFNS